MLAARACAVREARSSDYIATPILVQSIVNEAIENRPMCASIAN
jgi:hypothetical protein